MNIVHIPERQTFYIAAAGDLRHVLLTHLVIRNLNKGYWVLIVWNKAKESKKTSKSFEIKRTSVAKKGQLQFDPQKSPVKTQMEQNNNRRGCKREEKVEESKKMEEEASSDLVRNRLLCCIVNFSSEPRTWLSTRLSPPYMTRLLPLSEEEEEGQMGVTVSEAAAAADGSLLPYCPPYITRTA